jgi:bifunctional ADP-heptose synthase (sugar kinase/adenylyltransferase)
LRHYIKAVYVDGRLDLSQAVTVVDAAALAAGNATAAAAFLRDAATGIVVGRCRLTVSKPVLKARLVSQLQRLDTKI